MQLLDRPAWHSLTGPHASFSVGGPLARRYAPDVHVFAAAQDDSPQALQALSALVPAGHRAFLCEATDIVRPPGFIVVPVRIAVQMVADRAIAVEPEEFALLGDADAADMLALAQLTEPGPFLARTHSMGRFIGKRIDGRLAAMAGERFRFAGHTEVSGVCTHPDFRGQGLARSLSAAVAARIQARGERAFLHAWSSNHAAITLYERLGFRWRTDMQVAVLER